MCLEGQICDTVGNALSLCFSRIPLQNRSGCAAGMWGLIVGMYHVYCLVALYCSGVVL